MRSIKRVAATFIAVIAIALSGTTAMAANPTAGQCVGYNDPANTKVDTSDGSIVLPAGLTVCFKAGNGNTGQVVTDGESTIAEYIAASGLLNEGGQVPNISNYVIYGEVEPSTSPSASPSASVEPSASPSAPSVSPSPSMPATSSFPTPATTPSSLTPPPTDTASSASSSTTDNWFAILIAGIAFGLAIGLVVTKPLPASRRVNGRRDW